MDKFIDNKKVNEDKIELLCEKVNKCFNCKESPCKSPEICNKVRDRLFGWEDKIKHTNDSIVNSVINRMIERSKIGEKKYNTTLDREDLSVIDWLNHLQEELIDAVQYIEKLKKTIK